MSKTKRIQVRLTERDYDRMVKAASGENRSLSQAGEVAIKLWLDLLTANESEVANV